MTAVTAVTAVDSSDSSPQHEYAVEVLCLPHGGSLSYSGTWKRHGFHGDSGPGRWGDRAVRSICSSVECQVQMQQPVNHLYFPIEQEFGQTTVYTLRSRVFSLTVSQQLFLVNRLSSDQSRATAYLYRGGASAGNRTRVTSMATTYSTTRQWSGEVTR